MYGAHHTACMLIYCAAFVLCIPESCGELQYVMASFLNDEVDTTLCLALIGCGFLGVLRVATSSNQVEHFH